MTFRQSISGVRIVALLLSAAVVTLRTSAAAEPAPAPPNFVVIVADDLGYADLSCYGGKIPTPHLDALARSGMRFTDFHATPSCTSTRVALMTGRYHQRNGTHLSVDIAPQYRLWPQPTLASRLKARGYTTGVFGKWHLGAEPGFRPTERGFDEFVGYMTGDGDYHSRIDRSGKPDWWRGTEPLVEKGYTTDLITEHALAFLARHRDHPFFLYVPYSAVHFPWQGPSDPADRVVGTDYFPGTLKFGTRADKRAAFAEMVVALDAGVGRLTARLRELQLERRTVVVFLSDNGGYTVDAGGYVGVSNNGPWRGQKTNVYEGGHRVPGIVAWPGRVPAGSVSTATVTVMDLLPTFVELAGDSAVSGESDGVSLVGHLENGRPLPGRTLFWRHPSGKGLPTAIRQGSWKLVRAAQAVELFDLASDPGEKLNRATELPERVREMTGAMHAWEQSVTASCVALFERNGLKKDGTH